MKILSNNLNGIGKQSDIKVDFREKISQDEVKEIKESINKRSNEIMLGSISIQVSLSDMLDDVEQIYKDFKSFLNDIGYEGKSIAELSKDEAAKLVSEDGIFGVEQTSKRIADFVINGANGDEELLRAGREGMLKGFQEAEDMWGGELPQISQESMKKALEIVDKAMHDLGFSIIDKEV